ncbi:hypothetical protein DFJ74DRAFT_668160 [Hyaloraphidium curvatum]|nr:hypothetical protein DFJ74DRAFT_668160 [Hyaloraphidium curvatum]
MWLRHLALPRNPPPRRGRPRCPPRPRLPRLRLRPTAPPPTPQTGASACASASSWRCFLTSSAPRTRAARCGMSPQSLTPIPSRPRLASRRARAISWLFTRSAGPPRRTRGCSSTGTASRSCASRASRPISSRYPRTRPRRRRTCSISPRRRTSRTCAGRHGT